MGIVIGLLINSMSKFFKISLIVLGVVIFSISVLVVLAARGLPSLVIVTSLETDKDNVFYLNNQKFGTIDGFCATHRSGGGDWEIKLVQEGKEQKIFIKDAIRFNISEPIGAELGLVVFQANARQGLWKKFGCKI